MTDTAAIQARLAAARKGDWRYSSELDLITISPPGVCEGSNTICGGFENPFGYEAEGHANGELAAHAPTDIAALLQENRKLRLKASLVDRFPFCPDHRDKVAGKPCRECEIERLEGVVRLAYQAIKDDPTAAQFFDQRLTKDMREIASPQPQQEQQP